MYSFGLASLNDAFCDLKTANFTPFECITIVEALTGHTCPTSFVVLYKKFYKKKKLFAC